jgi:hypothetical protein
MSPPTLDGEEAVEKNNRMKRITKEYLTRTSGYSSLLPCQTRAMSEPAQALNKVIGDDQSTQDQASPDA